MPNNNHNLTLTLTRKLNLNPQTVVKTCGDMVLDPKFCKQNTVSHTNTHTQHKPARKKAVIRFGEGIQQKLTL